MTFEDEGLLGLHTLGAASVVVDRASSCRTSRSSYIQPYRAPRASKVYDMEASIRVALAAHPTNHNVEADFNQPADAEHFGGNRIRGGHSHATWRKDFIWTRKSCRPCLAVQPATEKYGTQTDLSDVYHSSLDRLVIFLLQSSAGVFEARNRGAQLRSTYYTIHVLPHSASPCDNFEHLRFLAEIRCRGQWPTLSSVQRSQRHSSLLRRLLSLAPAGRHT